MAHLDPQRARRRRQRDEAAHHRRRQPEATQRIDGAELPLQRGHQPEEVVLATRQHAAVEEEARVPRAPRRLLALVDLVLERAVDLFFRQSASDERKVLAEVDHGGEWLLRPEDARRRLHAQVLHRPHFQLRRVGARRRRRQALAQRTERLAELGPPRAERRSLLLRLLCLRLRRRRRRPVGVASSPISPSSATFASSIALYSMFLIASWTPYPCSDCGAAPAPAATSGRYTYVAAPRRRRHERGVRRAEGAAADGRVERTSGGRGPTPAPPSSRWTWSTESGARWSARSSGLAATWQLASASTSASSLPIAASTAAASSLNGHRAVARAAPRRGWVGDAEPRRLRRRQLPPHLDARRVDVRREEGAERAHAERREEVGGDRLDFRAARGRWWRWWDCGKAFDKLVERPSSAMKSRRPPRAASPASGRRGRWRCSWA